jgi:hypothetical protein
MPAADTPVIEGRMNAGAVVGASPVFARKMLTA